MNTEEKKALLMEEVKTLYQRSIIAIPLNYVVSTVITVVLYPEVGDKRLLAWLLMMFVLTSLRTGYTYWVHKRGDWSKYTGSYHAIYMLGSLFAGLLWITLFFMFAFKVPEVYLLFIIFTLGGMVIGAASSMATSPRSYLCYICPMLLPPAIIFLFEADILGFAISILLFITFFALLVVFFQNFRVYKSGMRLKLDRDKLIHNLKDSNKDLENAYEKIMNLSNTDELTGISNRRAFDLSLKKEWGRALRSNLPLSFIMVDIDFFKDYNDTFGHQEGDKCLQAVVTGIADLVKRPGDMIARYGGEEFCLILPDTELEGALVLAKSLKEKIELLKIPAANKSVSPYVTISLGVSFIRPEGKIIPEDLVYAADKALYLAKQHGRNRIETWETDV